MYRFSDYLEHRDPQLCEDLMGKGAAGAAAGVTGALQGGWEGLKQGAKGLWSALKGGFAKGKEATQERYQNRDIYWANDVIKRLGNDFPELSKLLNDYVAKTQKERTAQPAPQPNAPGTNRTLVGSNLNVPAK